MPQPIAGADKRLPSSFWGLEGICCSRASPDRCLRRLRLRVKRLPGMSMKRKTLLVGFVALVLFAGTAAWLFACALSNRAGTEVSVTLLSYTNDVAGIPVFGYTASNVMHSGFAIFSAHNPTRSHFACFLNCIIVRQAGTGRTEVVRLKGDLYSAQTNKTSLTGEDFQLPPGATVTFSVPTPDARGTWQCLLSLIHVRYYERRWQYEAVLFAERLGLHFFEQGQTVASREIAQ